MSSLISDLNQIYTIKGQIKEVANIDTDEFAYFPDLIAAAIQSGGATGTIDLTNNGTYNVATYAYAYINVPQEQVPYIPDGYTYVEGTYSITTNGTGIDISSYAAVDVDVPVPDGWVYPTGYAYITTNGDFNISEYKAVNVDVPIDWDDVAGYGYIVPAGSLPIDFNGTWDVKNNAYAVVNVPIDWDEVATYGYIIPAGTYTINTNGTEIDVVNYAAVDVAVPIDWAEVATYGYVVPAGTYNITANGTYSVSAYENVAVDVPIPSGYVYPNEIVVLDHNGRWDNAKMWADVTVAVPIDWDAVATYSYTYVQGTYNITANGTGIDVAAYAYVDVAVSGQQVSGYTYITENGNYDVASYEYAYVTVSGGDDPGDVALSEAILHGMAPSSGWVDPSTGEVVDTFPLEVNYSDMTTYGVVYYIDKNDISTYTSSNMKYLGTVAASGNPSSQPTVRIYAYDGTIYCDRMSSTGSVSASTSFDFSQDATYSGDNWYYGTRSLIQYQQSVELSLDVTAYTFTVKQKSGREYQSYLVMETLS